MPNGARATGVACLLLIAMSSSPLAAAGRVWFVPWKVLEPGAQPVEALFTLYWIPASPVDLKRSDLVTSRALAVYSSRCVAMHVIRLDDVARLEKLAVSHFPAALLADRDREIARFRNGNGVLRAADIEAMVRTEFDTREVAADAALDEARVRAAEGDHHGATALYKKVLSQRCAFPRQAKEARRRLRRLAP